MSASHGGFTVICPKCKSYNCQVDAFKTSNLTSVNPGGTAQPIIICIDCDYEWNGLIG